MKKEFSPVAVSNVKEHAFKPELDSAEIRQVVTTHYPARRINNTLFDESEFDLDEQVFDSTRVTWIDVPKGITLEQVQERVDKNPNLRLQRILDDKPIFLKHETEARTRGIISNDQWQRMIDRQVVRDREGKEVLFNNKLQYRRYQLSYTGEADIDNRYMGTEESVPDEAATTTKEVHDVVDTASSTAVTTDSKPASKAWAPKR